MLQTRDAFSVNNVLDRTDSAPQVSEYLLDVGDREHDKNYDWPRMIPNIENLVANRMYGMDYGAISIRVHVSVMDVD